MTLRRFNNVNPLYYTTFRPLALIGATSLVIAALPAQACAQASFDPSSISIDYIGNWVPVPDELKNDPSQNCGILIDGDATVRSAVHGADTIVLAGWPGCDLNEEEPTVPSEIAIISQTNDRLVLSTDRSVDTPLIAGAGASIVHDFDGDGLEDVFLAGFYHAVWPNRPVSSHILYQNADGTFVNVSVGDSVNAHDAQLFFENGEAKIISHVFRTGNELFGESQFNPIYEFNGRNIEVTENPYLIPSNMSLNVGEWDDEKWIVMGSFSYGDSQGVDEFDVGIIPFEAFRAEENLLGTQYEDRIVTLEPYHAARPDEYCKFVSTWGECSNHAPRVWVEDLNYDGRLDILANTSLFPHPYQNFKYL